MQGPGTPRNSIASMLPGRSTTAQTKTCACGCGQTFETQYKNRIYFSEHCKRQVALRSEATKQARQTRGWKTQPKAWAQCACCPNPFLKKNKTHKTCSKACSQELNRRVERTRAGATQQDWIPVAPVREAVLAKGIDLTVIAKELGWMNGVHGDITRIQRRLGLKPTSVKRRLDGTRPAPQASTRITYDLAVKIIRAADIDPVDVPGGIL